MNQTIFAQVEPTTKCNFTCGFCCGRQMDQSNLSVEKFKRLLDLFPEIQHLELQGEGEPLMNPEFFDLVELAHTNNINISFITNGSFLSLVNIQRILNYGIRSIRISLETAVPEKFKKIRGADLEIIEKGISRLLSERSRLGLDKPSIGFAVTILASTLADLPTIFDLYCRLGMDGGIAIQSLNRMPNYSTVYDQELETEYLEPEKHQQEYQTYMSSEIVRKIWAEKSPYQHFYDELFQLRGSDQAKGKLSCCPWLVDGINLDRHGRVTPCCMVKGENWSFGTIDDLTREQIINVRNNLAQELINGIIPAPCQGCKIAKAIVEF
jgi:MoaA/NifB/PqqE/SkfB family radical SAM enzyme